MNSSVKLANWLSIVGSRILLPSLVLGVAVASLGAAFLTVLGVGVQGLLAPVACAACAAATVGLLGAIWYERNRGAEARASEMRAWIRAGASPAEKARRQAIYDHAGQLGVDAERSTPSIDAHVKSHGMFDASSMPMPWANIDGTPMVGRVDANGNPYGVTNSDG